MKVALTLHRMRSELSGMACESDARVVLDTDSLEVSVKTAKGTFPLNVCGTRELRLIAQQLEWFAEHIDRLSAGSGDFEEVRE